MRALNRTSESFDIELERSKRVSNRRRRNSRRDQIQRMDIAQAEAEMLEVQSRSLTEHFMMAGRHDHPFARSFT